METFDVFQTVKSILYIGNYELVNQEVSNTDINDEDISQVAKWCLYRFLALIEENDSGEIKSLLKMIKEHPDPTIKVYFKIFQLYLKFYYQKQVSEQAMDQFYNDLANEKSINPIFFPAIYLISLILLAQKDYRRFLVLTSKYEQFNEIQGLKFYMFFELNKFDELSTTVELMTLLEPDSILTKLCTIIFFLYTDNNYDLGKKTLSEITQSYKSSLKIYNFIGVFLMSKGEFEKALKILTSTKDFQKEGQTTKDYNCIIANTITCLRNLWRFDEASTFEQLLFKLDPENSLFERARYFDQEIEKI